MLEYYYTVVSLHHPICPMLGVFQLKISDYSYSHDEKYIV